MPTFCRISSDSFPYLNRQRMIYYYWVCQYYIKMLQEGYESDVSDEELEKTNFSFTKYDFNYDLGLDLYIDLDLDLYIDHLGLGLGLDCRLLIVNFVDDIILSRKYHYFTIDFFLRESYGGGIDDVSTEDEDDNSGEGLELRSCR